MTDDDENESPKKKKKRDRTPKRRPPEQMYPDNMPEGSDVPVDPRFARQWGYDQESVRVNQVVRNAEKRKAAGDPNVRWDGPDHVKFEQARRESPHASIRFQQVEPVKTDNIPHKSLLQLDSWDKLVNHLATTHWNGKHAKYKVYIYDGTNYQKAALEVNFSEREESEPVANGQQPPGGPQYPGYPGYPPQQGYPTQMNPWGVGMPPQIPPQMWPMLMMQQPMQQQPAQQSQPVQQPQMPQFPFPNAGAMDPNVVAMLMQLTRENAALVEEVRRMSNQPQGQQQPMMMNPMAMMMAMYPHMFGLAPPPQQKPPEEKKPEPPPVDPMKQATDAISLMSSMASKAKDFANKWADPEPEPTPPAQTDDNTLPHVIKELPHMRAVFDRATGAPVDMVTMAMYNGDKLGDGLKGMLKEARGLFKDVTDEKMRARERDAQLTQQKIEQGNEQIRQTEVALQQGERFAELNQRMAAMGLNPDVVQNSPPVPPASPNGSGTPDTQ